MARKKSPTLLSDTSCLQVVRLEADEQSPIAIVETTSSEALGPQPILMILVSNADTQVHLHETFSVIVSSCRGS